MKAIEARDLTFKYQGQESTVLDHVFFTVEQGQVAAVTGPSGGGKSTLGYCLCGVIPNLVAGNFSGEVKLQGRVGIVFQDPDAQIFLPTVEDELAFGPENLGLPRAEIGRRIQKTLELIGLSGQRLENPAQLSGGQKQLVALGGVLTMVPDIIIMDETLSPLDERSRSKILRVIMELKQSGRTIILIEHEKRNLEIADQIWHLEQGRLMKLPYSGEKEAYG